MTRAGRAAARIYRLALRAFPASHRATYADEMVETFAGALSAQREQSHARSLWFVVAACVDAVRAGLGERRRHGSRFSDPSQVLGSVGRDLGLALRSLAKARTFSFVSVISLGIGIGTVVLMVIVVQGSTGRPPAIKKDDLVELLIIPQGALRAQVNDWAIDTWSYPDFADVRDANTGMTLTGWTPSQAVLRATSGAAGVRVDAMYVSPNYFTTLGTTLARGPGFSLAEAVRTGMAATGERGPEVVVSHRAWQLRLRSAADVIGSSVIINGIPHVVVGVTPDGFRGHLAQHRPGFEVWLPLDQHPRLTGVNTHRFNRNVDWVQILGRLTPGTSVVHANGVVSSIMSGIAEREPASNGLKSVSVEPYSSTGARRRKDMMAEALTALAAAVVVLLVVCLNMSGMVMVRGATRERELAVRLAIGASRRRLVQYLLSEAVVLALFGGALGATVIFAVPAALMWWFGEPLDVLFTPDAPTFVVCAGLCLATSLVFGVLPALRFSRPKVMRALKDEAGGGRRVGRLHRWTAAVQAGIAVPFIVVGAVQLDQFRATANADLGFDPAGLFAMPLDTSSAKSGDGDAAVVLRTIESHLARASGVVSVSVANGLPLDSQSRYARVARDGGPTAVRTHTTRVSPGYFDTMRVPLLRGRGITSDDQAGTEPVVVITQALALRLFPNEEPVGARLRFALDGSLAPVDPRWPHLSMPSAEQTFTVVGVAADLLDAYLGPPEPQLFVPLAQNATPHIYVIARSAAALQATIVAFEEAVAGLYSDADVLSANVVTAEQLMRRGRSELVIWSIWSAIAGGAALLLAALGIFGVIGFMVATRTREIGIRIALGATRSRVLHAVLIDAVKLAMWGVAGGLGLAFLWAREISWSTVGGIELVVYAGAVAIALGVAAAAALPAARRAAAVEPIVAMRAE